MSGERTGAEKLKKRSNPFCEPPMAVIGSKPPEANAAIGLSLSACLALSEVNPQNMAFGRKRLSGHILLSRYQKSPYMPPAFDGLYFLRMYPGYLL